MIIKEDQATSVECLPMNTALVKIETKNHKGPLKFNIDMHKPGDLLCYAHSHAKVNFDNKLWTYRYDEKSRKSFVFTPMKAFNENMLTGKMTVHDIDKNAWFPDALYALFFSEEGCQFSLRAFFVEEEIMKNNRANRKINPAQTKLMRGKFYEQFQIGKMITEAANKKAAVRAFNKEIEELKRARRIREKQNVKDNFLEINADQAEDYIYHK